MRRNLKQSHDHNCEQENDFSSPQNPVERHRCQWHTGSKQCKMLGTVSSDIAATAKYYCSWHFFARQDPRWSEDYQQFLSWRDNIIANYWQSEWHSNPEEIWRKVNGGTIREYTQVVEYSGVER